MEPSKISAKYRAGYQPDLHVVQGGGESTPERGNLRLPNSLIQPETDTGNRFGSY